MRVKYFYLLLASFIFAQSHAGPILAEQSRSIAGSLVKVRSLGSSYKGKYIAVEEYGYRAGKVPFARIRVIDVWKNRDMEDIEVKPADTSLTIDQVRERNRIHARSKVKRYKIFY